MKKLYCPECGNYLEGGDGCLYDCFCGWKQPEEAVSTEIDQLQAENAKLTLNVESLKENTLNDLKRIDGLIAENNALRSQLAAQPAVPKAWKLLKDTTQEERSYPEDIDLESGGHYNTCCHCLRQFVGHKQRIVCKSCEAIDAEKEHP